MSGKPAIPEWQRASAASSSSDVAASSPTQEEANAQPAAEAPTPTEDDVAQQDGEEQHSEDTSLLEQASRFLDDPAIREAPRDKKIAFLESKGVGADDIKTLLGEDTQETSPVEVEEAEEVAERAWPTVSIDLTSWRMKNHRQGVADRHVDAFRHRPSLRKYPKLNPSPSRARYPQSSHTQSSSQTRRSRRLSSLPSALRRQHT